MFASLVYNMDMRVYYIEIKITVEYIYSIYLIYYIILSGNINVYMLLYNRYTNNMYVHWS